MNWQDAADVRKKWGKQFCLKGIMSIADAKRAVDIGATAIMVSNHGGRQLDGSRSPFDQLAEIVDAVGDRIDVICDGGITRGTHVLKALSWARRRVREGDFICMLWRPRVRPALKGRLKISEPKSNAT
jgi:L-lactate dehydrogenase (FMN-dependent) and related alpha-hydroxy acid dehydrogenases